MNIPENNKLSIPTQEEFEILEKSLCFHKSQYGNKIAFYQYGDPKGQPLVFFHGTGSHLQGMCLHRPALEYGFRIIAPDRPGIGQSDFRSGWTVLEYARDIEDLANQLNIGSFGIIGISGAGPSLMASAYVLHQRLKCVIDLACGMPLYKNKEATKFLGTADKLYARLGTRLPLAAFQIPFSIIGLTMKLLRKPELFAKMFKSSLCKADQNIFAIKDFQLFLVKDFQNLFRNGTKGAAHDAQTVYKDWGFDLSEIKTHIECFHGTDDKFVPVAFSQYMAKIVPNSNLNMIEGQGHFCHLVYGFDTLRKIKALFY